VTDTTASVELHIPAAGGCRHCDESFRAIPRLRGPDEGRSPAILTLLVQLSCQHCGYLPTEKAVRGGGTARTNSPSAERRPGFWRNDPADPSPLAVRAEHAIELFVGRRMCRAGIGCLLREKGEQVRERPDRATARMGRRHLRFVALTPVTDERLSIDHRTQRMQAISWTTCAKVFGPVRAWMG